MNLALCSAHRLRGTLKKEKKKKKQKNYESLVAIADKSVVVLQASRILATEIRDRTAEGVLGRIEGTLLILIENAVVK